LTPVSAGTLMFGRDKRRFLASTVSRPALGHSQPPTHWLPKELLPEIKQKYRQTDHLPPSSEEVKNEWTYALTAHTGTSLPLVYHKQ